MVGMMDGPFSGFIVYEGRSSEYAEGKLSSSSRCCTSFFRSFEHVFVPVRKSQLTARSLPTMCAATRAGFAIDIA